MSAKRDLVSHRGYDRGSLLIAKSMAEQLDTIIVFSEISRLLVELNRSSDNPQLFSRYTNNLPEGEKKQILLQHYYPYRHQVESVISDHIAAGDSVLHLSIHTFTRRFAGKTRIVDLGVLYDPDRASEAELSCQLVNRTSGLLPRLRIRHNQPYHGADDGLTTYLRTKFAVERYLGFEIEICNSFAKWSLQRQTLLLTKLATAIKATLAAC